MSEIVLERKPDSALIFNPEDHRYTVASGWEEGRGWKNVRFCRDLASAALAFEDACLPGATPEYVGSMYDFLDDSTCREIARNANDNLYASDALTELVRDQVEEEVDNLFASMGDHIREKMGCSSLAQMARALAGSNGLPSLEEARIMTTKDEVFERLTHLPPGSERLEDGLLRAARLVGPDLLPFINEYGYVDYCGTVEDLCLALGTNIIGLSSSLRKETPSERAMRATAAAKRVDRGVTNAAAQPKRAI